MSLSLVLVALGAVLLALAGVVAVNLSRTRPAREVANGLAVLRSLRWRDFAQMVVRSLEARGFKPDPAHGIDGPDAGDIVLSSGKVRYVLHVKHGGAYHVGAAAVRALVKALTAHGAQSGLLVTTGNFTADANSAATGEPVSLIEGERLWRDIRHQLPEALLSDALFRVAETESAGRRQASLLAVLGALTFCAGSWTWYQSRDGEPAQAAAPVVTPAPAVAPPAAAAPPAVAGAPAPTAPRTDPRRDYTESELATQRELLAAEVLLVPGVNAVAWPSRSTLMLTLRSSQEPARSETLARVCERISQREALLFTRLQVLALDTGPDTVRWHRCA